MLQSLTRKPAQEPLDKKAMPQSTDKKPEPSSTPFRTSGSSQATAKPSQGKPTLKRDSSSIFKAFAKTRPKQPKEEETDVRIVLHALIKHALIDGFYSLHQMNLRIVWITISIFPKLCLLTV